MSAPKFTPGPWATHPDQPTQVMDCADESFIADCEGLEPGGRPSDGANARLIAAAPELYEALERALPVLIAAAMNASYADTYKPAQQIALDMARAALAKVMKP